MMIAGLLLWLALALPAAASEALKGVALVIGQSKYENVAPLANPARDAAAISELLGSLGFETESVDDRKAKRLRGDIDDFIEDSAGADVALIYYSGHAIEAGGENFLIPTDAAQGLDIDALVPVAEVLNELRQKARIVIVLLDACRTSPYPQGTTLRLRGGGVAPVAVQGLSTPRGFVAAAGDGADAESLGVLIGFAAAPGEVALDGEPGGNSPYAAALLKHFAAPGAAFGDVMTMVAEEVYIETAGRQQPWANASLRRLLYFGGAGEELETDEAKLRAGRRDLLLTISALPRDLRRTVEQLAQDDGLPLAPLYGILEQLRIDPNAGVGDFEKQLRAGAARLKRLIAEHDAISQSDPEILRLSGLADQAQGEGALRLAQDYRKQASARAVEISKTLQDTETELKVRHIELAATFANDAKTASLVWQYRRAAEMYGRAHAEVARWDEALAAKYKWDEAAALSDLGDRMGGVADLSLAIDAYRAALAHYRQDTSPLEWWEIQYGLGVTLARKGNRETGTRLLLEALTAFRAAAAGLNDEASPEAWVRTHLSLSRVVADLGAREQDPQRYDEAVRIARTVLERLAADHADRNLMWAEAQMTLSATLMQAGEYHVDTRYLEQSAEALRAALGVLSKDKYPLEWAAAQNNLSLVLRDIGSRSRDTKLLWESVTASLAALEVYVPRLLPDDRSGTLSNLCVTLLKLSNIRPDEKLFDEALDTCREAAESADRKRNPMSWAHAQINFGAALRALGERRNDAGVLTQSLAAFGLPLDVLNRATAPDEWAIIQFNNGRTLHQLGMMRKDPQQLRQAIARFRDTLEVRTFAAAPRSFAATHVELAYTLNELGNLVAGPERLASWQEALSSLHLAEQVLTAAEVPNDWSNVQNNIGFITVQIGKETSDAARIREAVMLLHTTLQTQLKAKDHFHAAYTADSLCFALLHLGKLTGDKSKLLAAKDLCQQSEQRLKEAGDNTAAAGSRDNIKAIDAALAELP